MYHCPLNYTEVLSVFPICQDLSYPRTFAHSVTSTWNPPPPATWGLHAHPSRISSRVPHSGLSVGVNSHPTPFIPSHIPTSFLRNVKWQSVTISSVVYFLLAPSPRLGKKVRSVNPLWSASVCPLHLPQSLAHDVRSRNLR